MTSRYHAMAATIPGRQRRKDPPPAPGHRNPHRQRRHNNRRKHGRRDVNAGCRGFLFLVETSYLWWKPAPPGKALRSAPVPAAPASGQTRSSPCPSAGKGGEAENGERYQPRVPRLAMKSRPGSGLPHSRGKHTGDGPGFKIIDMKLINDERQYRANIRSVGVIDGIHQKNHRQNHETIFRFPASVQTSVSIRDIGFPRFIPHPLRCKLPLRITAFYYPYRSKR